MTIEKTFPQISILVPVYGVEKLMEQCAVSLLEQDYPRLQFVFVNDCTPDGSMDVLHSVLERYPDQKSNVVIIHHQRNLGLAAARNTALDAATGEFVMPIDSDDYLSCRTAVSQIMKETLREKADAAMYDIRHIFPDKMLTRRQTVPSDSCEYVRLLLRRETPVCICGGMYKKSLFTDHDIRAIEHLNMGEDYAVKPRLLYFAKKIIHVPHDFYCYTHLSGCSYTGKFSDQYASDLKQALDVLSEFFMHVPDAADFEPSLSLARRCVQAELFLWWGLHHGNRSSFTHISQMSSPLRKRSGYGLSLKHRIALFLAYRNLRRSLRLYAYWGVKIKHLLN